MQKNRIETMNNQQQIQQLEKLIRNTQTTINNHRQELANKEIDLKEIQKKLNQIKNQTNINNYE